MKNKFILLFLFFINISYFCFAQPNKEMMDKAEAIQIAYLTKELGLSADEAQKFWPVYNDYKDQIKRARKENTTDEIEYEERVVNIRKKYKPDFRRVLGNDERVNKIFVADKNFRELLRKELMNRRMQNRPNIRRN
jgi:small-conductance mechanosensitive channel